MKKIILLIATVLIFAACEKDNIKPDNFAAVKPTLSQLIQGKWNYLGYNDTISKNPLNVKFVKAIYLLTWEFKADTMLEKIDIMDTDTFNYQIKSDTLYWNNTLKRRISFNVDTFYLHTSKLYKFERIK